MQSSPAVPAHRPPASRSRGFSLLELMIVVSIVAVLAMIAIPSYSSYIKKANRSSASQIMLNIQSREEQYMLDARAYTSALNATGLNIVHDGWTCSAASCVNNFYTVTVAVVAGTPPTYTITATPKAGTSAVSDGILTLTNAGVRTRSAGDFKW